MPRPPDEPTPAQVTEAAKRLREEFVAAKQATTPDDELMKAGIGATVKPKKPAKA